MLVIIQAPTVLTNIIVKCMICFKHIRRKGRARYMGVCPVYCCRNGERCKGTCFVI